MTRDEIQKLLGGYSTGTLTPEEQQALFAAALDDQDLFDALAKEQALRDLLRDPAARAHVLAALDERPQPWWQRVTRWAMRPAAISAMAACLAAVAGYEIWQARQLRTPQMPVITAENDRLPVAPTAPAPEPARADSPASRRGAVREPVPPPGAAAPTPIAAPSPQVPAPVLAAARPAASAPAPQLPVLISKGASSDAVNQSIPGPPPANQARQLETQGLPQQSDSAGTQQTVTVTAEAAGIQTQSAARKDLAGLTVSQGQTVELPMKSGAALLMSRPEVKWSALRREGNGRLSSVEADQIRAGDVIVVRLEPYADGYLSVAEKLPGSAGLRVVLARTRVTRAKAVVTPALTLDHPGVQELLVQFTGQKGVPAFAPGAPAMRSQQAAAVKKDESSMEPAQTISLRYR